MIQKKSNDFGEDVLLFTMILGEIYRNQRRDLTFDQKLKTSLLLSKIYKIHPDIKFFGTKNLVRPIKTFYATFKNSSEQGRSKIKENLVKSLVEKDKKSPAAYAAFFGCRARMRKLFHI